MKHTIRRKILEKIEAHLSEREMTLIVGPRQVGKTTLIRQVLANLEKRGEQTVFFNLDIEEDARWFESQRALLDRLSFLTGDPRKLAANRRIFVAIDEVQRKADAGRFMKGLFDLELPYKFILSGSGSLELKEGIAESMMGRKRMFYISPVSFNEFVDYRTDYAYCERLCDFGQSEPARLYGLLLEYLNLGGYPKVITTEGLEEKKATLQEIVSSFLDRDISAFLRLNRPDAFRNMLAILASQNGQILNINSLAAQIGLSSVTLKNYLYYAEKTFSIALLQPYFRNAQKEITKAQTPYFVDLGFRNLVLGRFGTLHEPQDLAFSFQNLIYHVLGQTFPGSPIKYWRTQDKAEVDFVVEASQYGELLPVEVKFTPLKRLDVAKSLRSFIGKYHPKEAWVVNLSLSDTINIDDAVVRFVPLSQLLGNMRIQVP